MLVKSARFGDLTVDEQEIIHFRNGLPGFPEEQEFLLLPYQENSPFVFLQSVREENLSFLLTDPFVFFADYEFKLEDNIVQDLELSSENLPQILNIVTVPEDVEKMTANLLAPVIINTRNRRGIQIVLENASYTTKHLLFPQGFSRNACKGGK